MKHATMYEHYTSSPGMDWNMLVSEAIRAAQRSHPELDWKLEGVYEYDREVYDEKGKLIDIEARIIVRGV